MDFKELQDKIIKKVIENFDYGFLDELITDNPNLKANNFSFDKFVDYDEDESIRDFILDCEEQVINDNLQKALLLIMQVVSINEYKKMCKEYDGDLGHGLTRLINAKNPHMFMQIYKALETHCKQLISKKQNTMKGTKTAVWGKKSHRDELASALSKNFRKML